MSEKLEINGSAGSDAKASVPDPSLQNNAPDNEGMNVDLPAGETNNEMDDQPVIVTAGGYTIRRPDEILSMKFDPSDHILGERLLSRGQLLTILGQGGIGKSILALILAVCLILGRKFFNFEVRSKRLKILLIQAENGNERLQENLVRLRKWVGEDEWAIVNDHLVIHTLETQADYHLDVQDGGVCRSIRKLVMEVRPDVIITDSLQNFTYSSLNSDASMRNTVESLLQLSRTVSPRTATIILHHAQPGRAGVRKATGLDRSVFGRNSRVLTNMTRGQINLSPLSEDTNERLLVSCGKNSNGPEFQPFGIRLNPETGIYEVDPTYVAPSLAEAQGAPAGPNRAITAEQVLAVVLQGPISRKQLVDRLMGVTGKAKSVVYTAIKRAEDTTICLDENDRYVPVSELGKPEADTP